MKKAHQRQLEIIELLYNDASWHRFNDIAEAVNASVFSIRDDIATISSLFAEYLTITENKQTVRAEFRQDANLETFQRYFLYETVPLQFIEALFFHPFMELEDLADKILTSRSTVYRFIPELNGTLQSVFQLELTTKPLKIVGEELKIRDFFTIFFNTRYHPLTWPFPDLDETAIQNVIQLMCDVLRLTTTPAQFHQLKYMVAIGIVRYQKRFYLSPQYLTKDVSTAIARIFPYLEASPHVRYFSQLIHQDLDQAAIFNLFYPVLIASADLRIDSTQEDHQLLKQLLEDLCQTLDLEITEIDTFVHGLISVYQKKTAALINQSIKIERAQRFSQKMKDLYPDLHQGLVQVLTTFDANNEHILSDTVLNQLLFFAMTHWPNLLMQLQEEKVPVPAVVISDISDEHAQLIATHLKTYFQDELTVETIHGSYANALDKESPYKIIITTFDLTVSTDKYIVNVDPFPDDQTYLYIQQLVNTIQNVY